MNEIKPCPFCGSTEIHINLRGDCYSSWAECLCTSCGAYLHVCVDKDKDDTFPNPKRNWKQFALKFWNDDYTEIKKNITLIKTRAKSGDINA